MSNLDQVKWEVPDEIKESIARYVNDKIHPGGFLTAVLANDLGAVIRADDTNYPRLAGIYMYVKDNVPFVARGSYTNIDAWL